MINGKEKIMKNNANPFKKIALVIVSVFLASLLILSSPAAAKKSWNGIVHAPLKTARSFDWSAPDEFFSGKEQGKIEYTHSSDRFEGVLELARFKQAGPYVLTVDTGKWPITASASGNRFLSSRIRAKRLRVNPLLIVCQRRKLYCLAP
jgi:hypothetical protein